MQASPFINRPAAAPAEFTDAEKRELLSLARQAIMSGLDIGPAPLPVDAPHLQREGACFVTLKKNGELRGCIGTLVAHRSLAADVIQNARNAALRDPRFPPLSAAEFPGTTIAISVLTSPRPLPVKDEAQLLQELRPGEDGLILEDGSHRATFLPSVWEQLPEPELFLAQLRRKAGLPAGYWSPSLRFSRYRSIEFSETDVART